MSSASLDASLARRLYRDFPLFARLCLKIEGKDGKLVPFELNAAQKIVWKEIKRQMDARLPVKVLTLKGRQQGMSTLFQAISMWLACTREGFKGMTVVHKFNPAGVDLFGKVELMHENLPPEIAELVPVAPGKQAGRRLKFGEPMRSMLVVESAEEAKAVGRSGTFMFGHLTEIPWWPKAEETVAAFLATVENNPESMVLVESTAQGYGNWFADQWAAAEKAVEEGTRPAFQPVFVPWFVTPEYRRKRDPLDAPLTGSERKRMKKLGITEEQILWYRDKIAASGDLAQQEYPDTPRDAFLSSGMPYFRQVPLAKLRKHAEDASQAAKKGHWRISWNGGRVKAKFEQGANGDLWVWESPKAGHVYVVSVDPSTGRAKDNSAYHVLDVTDGSKVQQVASYQGKLPAEELAVDSILTANYYNKALWVCERNTYGEGAITKMKDIGYENVYHMRNQTASGKRVRSKEPGWIQSRKSRPYALECLAELVHNDLIELNDVRTIREMENFIFVDDAGEKARAAQGAHDDMVLSLAIGVAARDQAGGEVSFEVWD